MTTPISKYEDDVKKCFKAPSSLTIWYGGTEGKIGNDPNMMYIALPEDRDWWQNKCILKDWYFEYNLFGTLPLNIDCYSYGVFVVWIKND
jgi:hypothetical protein